MFESMSGSKGMTLESDGKCFVCGKKNPKGLRLDFTLDREKQTLETTFHADPAYQGYDGIVHGGIISTLLDEAMAKLCYDLGYSAVTAALEIRFKKPAPTGESLLVHGEIVEAGPKLIRAKAWMAKEDGTVLALASGTLMRKDPAREML
jgi:uncharacterized protein (TIGR00369 family)